MKISLNQLSLIGLGFLMCTAGHRVVAKNKKSEQNIKNCLTMLVRCDIIFFVVEVWLSLVEYFVRDEGVAGSNPVTSTKMFKVPIIRHFFFCLHDFYTILLRISIARSSSRGYRCEYVFHVISIFA